MCHRGMRPWMLLPLVVVVVGLASTVQAKDNPAGGLEQLAAKDIPLAQGETIAFLGDSITQGGAGQGGYCRLIAEAIEKSHADKKVKIVYAGISGNKVPDLQRRLQNDVLAKKPTMVWIYIGINDVWHSDFGQGTPKEKFEAGLKDIIGQIQKSGAVVVLATPSVIGEKTDGSNKHDKALDEYSAIIRKVAQENHLTVGDLRAEFLAYLKKNNPENKANGILTGDGVHLNAAGNRFVADKAAAALLAAAKARK